MVVTDYNEQFLDKRGTDHLIEELKTYIDGIATGDIDLSSYVTKQELQAALDALDINIDLSDYATKEELTQAINGIDLSSYATKEEIPSLDGYATTEYVDNAVANVPSGGEVDLSNYYTKEETDALIPSTEGLATETYVDNKVASIPVADLSNYYTKEETYNKTEVDTLVANSGGSSSGSTTDLSNYYTKDEVDERDLMISPFASLGEKYVTDNMPDIKAYEGTNTITFEAGTDVYGGILVDGEAPYYFNDYSVIDSSKNSFTFEADSEVTVKDYVFYFGESTEGLSDLTFTITNGSKSDVYSIPIYGDGMQEVFYRKIKQTPLYKKQTKLDFAKSSFSPINDQVYKNRDEITRLKESGLSGADGTTPHIDSTTKHWMIGDTDTGVMAEGVDGVSPTVTVTKSGKVATITCTDVNGTTTATISDGADGSSSGGSSGGSTDIYSTEEVAIGTWINGQTIYRKVITMDLPNISSGSYHSAVTVVESPCNIMMIDWRAVSYAGKIGSSSEYPLRILHGDGFRSAVVWTTKTSISALTQELCKDLFSVFHNGDPTSSYINCYYGQTFSAKRCDFILDYIKVETTE